MNCMFYLQGQSSTFGMVGSSFVIPTSDTQAVSHIVFVSLFFLTFYATSFSNYECQFLGFVG